MNGPLQPPALVKVTGSCEDSYLFHRGKRVKLPVLATLIAVKGANGYYSYKVYVAELRTNFLLARSQVEAASVVDHLAAIST